MTSHTNLRQIAAVCVIYTVAAANEYWLINWMNTLFNIRLAIFFALLQNSTWPIQLLFYLRQKSLDDRQSCPKRVVTQGMLKSYFLLGMLSSFITLSRTFGLTTLPPTVYVICANTEIIFETIMTRFVLHKSVSVLQMTSVFLVIAGLSVALYNPVSKRYGHNENITQPQLIVGVTVSLASRFASSVNTISAEKFLGQDVKSYFGVLEISIANSLVPSMILPFALLFIPETKEWGLLVQNQTYDTILVSVMCVVIALSKYADRLCKFTIVHAASTLFFAVVDANMKVVAGLGSFLFFNEKIYWPQILGFTMIVFSMVVSIINKYVSNKESVKNSNKESVKNSKGSFELSTNMEIHCEMASQSHLLHKPQNNCTSQLMHGYALLSSSVNKDKDGDDDSINECGNEVL